MAFLSRVIQAPPRSWYAGGAALSISRALHVSSRRPSADKSYQFVVCGGGAGGLAVGSSLARRFGEGKLAIIEPAEVRGCLTKEWNNVLIIILMWSMQA